MRIKALRGFDPQERGQGWQNVGEVSRSELKTPSTQFRNKLNKLEYPYVL
jgi:hypothetical protein